MPYSITLPRSLRSPGFALSCALLCAMGTEAFAEPDAPAASPAPAASAPAAQPPASAVLPSRPDAGRRVEIEGVSFADAMEVGGQTLVLNGVAVNKRAFFKVQAVGLYLPQRVTDPEAILALDGPKRLRLIMLRGISARVIAVTFRNDFRRWAQPAEMQQLAALLDRVYDEQVAGPDLEAGDEVIIDWIPGQGMVTQVNGKRVAPPLDNELFFRIATLRPALSAEAPDELRLGLGGRVPLPSAPVPVPASARSDAAASDSASPAGVTATR